MRLNPVFLTVLAVFGTGIQARANLLVNGSFEQPGAALTTNYTGVGSGGQVTGWTTQAGNGPGGTVYYAATNNTANWLPNASGGNYFVQLDSTTQCCNAGAYSVGSSIAQSFNVAQGVTYQLTFDLNTEVGQPGQQSQVLLSFAGAYSTQNGTSAGPAFTIAQAPGNGTTKANTLWTTETYTFTATSTGLTTLRFTDGPGCNNNVALDNVSVEVVPEFSHWAVFAGFGLLVVGFNRRLRRRREALVPVAVRVPITSRRR